MTTKLEQAARQALEALENERSHMTANWDNIVKAITALREALDHSCEADEMVVGWDRVKPEAIASDPLYQQGFVDGVEEGRNQVAEQAEQEPVAWAHPSGGYLSARYMKEFATGLEKETHIIPLYAAPVRTKDLTDDEILEIVFKLEGIGVSDYVHQARAVIAADREKNK